MSALSSYSIAGSSEKSSWYIHINQPAAYLWQISGFYAHCTVVNYMINVRKALAEHTDYNDMTF